MEASGLAISGSGTAGDSVSYYDGSDAKGVDFHYER